MRKRTKWIRDKSDSILKETFSSVIGAREPVTLKFYEKKRRGKTNFIENRDQKEFQTEVEFSSHL